MARRGRRCPLAAHAVAVVAARRLRCGARPGVASRNSLRLLRSLRSNSHDESEGRFTLRARPRALRFSAAQRRPAGRPPAHLRTQCRLSSRTPRQVTERQAVPGGGDFCGGEERRTGVGARSALHQLIRRDCLSVVSAANEASFATRPRDLKLIRSNANPYERVGSASCDQWLAEFSPPQVGDFR